MSKSIGRSHRRHPAARILLQGFVVADETSSHLVAQEVGLESSIPTCHGDPLESTLSGIAPGDDRRSDEHVCIDEIPEQFGLQSSCALGINRGVAGQRSRGCAYEYESLID